MSNEIVRAACLCRVLRIISVSCLSGKNMNIRVTADETRSDAKEADIDFQLKRAVSS